MTTMGVKGLTQVDVDEPSYSLQYIQQSFVGRFRKGHLPDVYVATTGHLLVSVRPRSGPLDAGRVDRVVAGRRPRDSRLLTPVPPPPTAPGGPLVGRVDIGRHITRVIVTEVHQSTATVFIVVVETVDVGCVGRTAAESPGRLQSTAVVM